MTKWYVCYSTNTVAETLNEAVEDMHCSHLAVEQQRHEKGWRQWLVSMGAMGTGTFFPGLYIYEIEAESSKDAYGQVAAWYKEKYADVIAKQRQAERLIKAHARQLPPYQKEGRLIIDDEGYLRIGPMSLGVEAEEHFTQGRERTWGELKLGRARITIELLPEGDEVESDTSE